MKCKDNIFVTEWQKKISSLINCKLFPVERGHRVLNPCKNE